MKRIACLVLGVLAYASLAAAQVAPVIVITSADVLVLPATGDPVTIAPMATRNTVVSATSASCNQAAMAVGPTPLINPTNGEIDDPFNAGRKCRLAIPVGLPNGTGYRAVALFRATCDGVACQSPRSAVGVPPFDIAGTPALPAAPTGLAVRP